MTTQDDRLERLIRIFQAGGADAPEACARLMHDLLPVVRACATMEMPAAIVGLSDAEDIVQETMIAFVLQLPHFEFRGRSSLAAYLRRTVIRKICDAFRRSQTGKRNSDETAGFWTDEKGARVEPVDSRSPDGLHHSISREKERRMWAMVGQLVGRQREVVELVQMYGLNLEEAAHEMGLTESTVRYHLVRAHANLARRLRRTMDESEFEGEDDAEGEAGASALR